MTASRTLLLTALALTTLSASAKPRERCLLYRVERIPAASAPQVDGDLTEPVWRDRAAITTLRNFMGATVGDLTSQRSEFVLLTDGTKLYIGATFYDDDMAAVRFNPAAEPFWNDCIELYLDPLHDGAQSIQLVVDCGGRRWWQKQFNRGYGWWEDQAWHTLANWEAAASRQADRWTLELSLDCDFLGIRPEPGRICGFNACRFRLGSASQEFSAWGFDAISRQKAMPAWGHLLFAAEGEQVRGRPVTRADIRLVAPDLRGRMLEVLLEAGLQLFTARGEQRVLFRDLALTEAACLAQARDRALAALPASTQREELDDLARTLRDRAAGPLTLGAYDRLVADADRALVRLDNAYWASRLTELVTAVREGRQAQ